jgi:demethoxyubiquinone hydroxylase (CLK1/Coq7/Cat5 family)
VQATTEPAAGTKTGTRHPYLIMQTPTTAELRIAIQVLERLGERLTAHANHSIIEMPETQLGNHYAGQIESKAIEQTTRIKLVTAQLKTWRDELLQQRQTVSHHV